MRSVLRRVAVLAASLAILGEAPAPSILSEEAVRTFAVSAGSRTSSVQSYTSKLHVDFALRTFPYIKVHLDGRMDYKRPNIYSVHFDHVPWFGKGFENIKADPLQPSMWAEHYDVTSIERSGDRTRVEMRDKVAGNVKNVRAELDSDGLRKIQWLYTNGGKINVEVNPHIVDGVPVPLTEDADIKLPAYHVVAHATFTDYKIVTDAPKVDAAR
jgi:hypothetical protein